MIQDMHYMKIYFDEDEIKDADIDTLITFAKNEIIDSHQIPEHYISIIGYVCENGNVFVDKKQTSSDEEAFLKTLTFEKIEDAVNDYIKIMEYGPNNLKTAFEKCAHPVIGQEQNWLLAKEYCNEMYHIQEARKCFTEKDGIYSTKKVDKFNIENCTFKDSIFCDFGVSEPFEFYENTKLYVFVVRRA